MSAWASVSAGAIGTGQVWTGDDILELKSHGYPHADATIWRKVSSGGAGSTTVKVRQTGATISASIYSGTTFETLSSIVGTSGTGEITLTFTASSGVTYWVAAEGVDPDKCEIEWYVTPPSQVANVTTSYSSGARSFACSTSGATIWWRRSSGDGKWRKYISPVVMASTTTVEYKATKDGLLKSDVLGNG